MATVAAAPHNEDDIAFDGVLEAHAVDDSARWASLGTPTGFRLCHWKELREAYHPATVDPTAACAFTMKALHIRWALVF
jgi:hypothetical protein